MSHTYTANLSHIIFSTKERSALIRDEFREELHRYTTGIVKNVGATLLGVNTVEDHLHMLAHVPPRLALAEFINKIKTNSSRWLNESRLSPFHFDWQDGYGAFSVSRSGVSDVLEYIANQKEHHRKRTFREEFVEFLRRYEIEFDEKYLWK